jgi:hypothetical protein
MSKPVGPLAGTVFTEVPGCARRAGSQRGHGSDRGRSYCRRCGCSSGVLLGLQRNSISDEKLITVSPRPGWLGPSLR